jgi:hypothetical protein
MGVGDGKHTRIGKEFRASAGCERVATACRDFAAGARSSEKCIFYNESGEAFSRNAEGGHS